MPPLTITSAQDPSPGPRAAWTDGVKCLAAPCGSQESFENGQADDQAPPEQFKRAEVVLIGDGNRAGSAAVDTGEDCRHAGGCGPLEIHLECYRKRNPVWTEPTGTRRLHGIVGAIPDEALGFLRRCAETGVSIEALFHRGH